MTRVVRAALLASACLVLAPSRADAAEPGFAVDRFEPSERGSTWFALESLDLRGHVRPAFGAVGSYQYRPLVVRSGDEVRAAIVNHVLTTHLGGALNLWERLRLAVNVPLVLYTEGQQATIRGAVFDPPQDAQQIGDVRLGADVRLFGEADGPATVALGAQVWLPTGSPASYTGDGVLRAGPRVLAAGVVGPFAYAGKVGVTFRDPEADQFAGSPLGHELVFAAAAGYRFDGGRGVVGPEVFGATALGDATFKTRTSPLEALLGAHYSIVGGLRAGAGVGTGLVSGYGAPELRLVGSVEWMMLAPGAPEVAPPAPPPVAEVDTDGDGIPDRDDACMDVQGKPTNDPRTNGCTDRDGDGILDPLDHCPFEAGPANVDPDLNGCPPPPPPPAPPDADNDGIPDQLDACPQASGKPNPDPKRNGCPKILVLGEQIRSFTELPEDEEAMQQIVSILKDDPGIKRLRVEGHTDNRGDPKANKKASQERADAIAKWLTSHGIDKTRVGAVGVGGERPIEANDTEEGRAVNRRIELHIERQ